MFRYICVSRERSIAVSRSGARNRISHVTETTAPHQVGRDRATLRHIAADTGLSMSTVSQALRGAGRISEATRQRVVEASSRLAYRANVSALHMRGARTGLVGLVAKVPDATSWSVSDLDFLVRCERGFCDVALKRSRYPVMLSGASVADAIGTLPVDGVAVIDPGPDDPLLRLLEERSVPYVTLGRDVLREAPTPWVVDNDKREITRFALDGLRTRGMRHALLVTADTGQNYMTDVADAFVEWGEAHPDVATVTTILPLPFDAAEATRRVREACRAGVDTVYLAVEAALPAVLDAVAAEGRSIPRDVQVLTTTDSTRAQTAQPAVSAIDLHPRALGERLFALLEQRISGAGADAVDRQVAAEVHWRESTRPE
jgi:DNA-binding LacI/PurR family transcriptional regulator